MGKTFKHFSQDYSDFEYDEEIREHIERLYAQAYERQRIREAEIWEKRRSGSVSSHPR